MIFNYSVLITRNQQEAEGLNKYFGYKLRDIVFEVNNTVINGTWAFSTGLPLS